MTSNMYFHMVLSATIGIVLQLLYKAWRLQQKAKLSNNSFLFFNWMKEDAIILIINILSPYVVVYLFDELAFSDEYIDEKLSKWIKTLFVFVGFTGSSILMGFFSLADKKLNKIIDTKTNIADFGSDQKP